VRAVRLINTISLRDVFVEYIRDCSNDIRTTVFDGLDSFPRCAMLKHNLQLRESFMQHFQRRQETTLGIQDCDVLAMITRTLSVQVQHHATLLHGLKDRVEWFVAQHTRSGIGSDTRRVRFNADDPLSFGAFDSSWSDAFVEIQSHEIVDARVDGAETLLVGE